MHFKLNVNITDNDYIDYNTFVSYGPSYGRKNLLFIRLLSLVVFALCTFVVIFFGDDLYKHWLFVVMIAITAILHQVFSKKIMAKFIKIEIMYRKKQGKLPFEPNTVMEFYDDYFVDFTPDSKTEVKYSAIDRVSVINDKYIYLHLDSARAHLLSSFCFESKEQYDSFVDFIKTKCKNVDVY